MEKLLQKNTSMRNLGVSFFRHESEQVLNEKLRTFIPSKPYLINIFLISCSPAELNSASVDKNKCKAILGQFFKCKFILGQSIILS